MCLDASVNYHHDVQQAEFLHLQRQMPPEAYRDEHTPLGYLITFRSYGTWLHGKSGSVDRFHNTYGTPTLTTDAARLHYNQRALSQSPVTLRAKQSALVEEAIRETCEIRKWSLWGYQCSHQPHSRGGYC